MPKRRYIEGEMHRRIVRTITRIEGLRFYHPPNEAMRNPRMAMIMRTFGTVSSVPDLFIFGIEGQRLMPLCIELKRPGERPKPAQQAWLNALEGMGWASYALDTYEGVLDALEAHGYIDSAFRSLIWEDERDDT